MKKRRKRTQK